MSIENIKQENQKNRKHLIVAIVKILLLLVIVIGIPAFILLCNRDIIVEMKNFDDVVAYLQHYERESVLVYIGLQILQIVISVLPGQVFQMAAGYLYGFWWALLYAMIGAIIGTAITFMLAKALGRDFLHLFFGEEKMSYYIDRFNSKQGYMLVFLIYLIPGLPKDVVSYAAGASEIKFKPFIILSAVGRLPGMIGSLLMGYFLNDENYTGLLIVASIAVIAFILCIIKRKRINEKLDKIYEKLSK